MATSDQVLAEPPDDARARELWLQHGAGMILFEDVRGYALRLMDPNLTSEARQAAIKAINDSLYGVMMVFDGVTGAIRGSGRTLSLRTLVRLEVADEVIDEIDLGAGDGMCMGYHGWLDGDFGADPVVVQPAPSGGLDT